MCTHIKVYDKNKGVKRERDELDEVKAELPADRREGKPNYLVHLSSPPIPEHPESIPNGPNLSSSENSCIQGGEGTWSAMQETLPCPGRVSRLVQPMGGSYSPLSMGSFHLPKALGPVSELNACGLKLTP